MSRSFATFSSYLVTPLQLAQALEENKRSDRPDTSRVIPICGSWFLPNDPEKRTGLQVFNESRITGARFFNLDKIVDTTSAFPHMLPSADDFKKAMSEMGLRREDTLVVYDTKELGIFSAPRVAWTLRVFGHPSVHILNNFRLYVQQGFPIETRDCDEIEPSDYPATNLEKSQIVAFEEMRQIALDRAKGGNENVQILDARSEGRWKGTDPEPRPGLSSGHMPGSISLPVQELLDPATKAFLSPAELRAVFRSRGVEPAKPIIASCGTGVTAAIIQTALNEANWGEGERRIYDGSWTEWAQCVKPDENLIVMSFSDC